MLAEITATNRTALYRFTFPTDGTPTKKGDGTVTYSPLILADLTDLSESRSNASIQVGDNGRITGRGTFRPSFGFGTYTLHFCADFAGANIRRTGVFMNNRPGTTPKNITIHDDGNQVPAGAWVQFQAPKHNQITARIGLSFISSEQACENAEREIPMFEFNDVKRAAESAWRSKLSSIQVDNTGVSTSLQKTFWSGLYRTLLSPQDYTGTLFARS